MDTSLVLSPQWRSLERTEHPWPRNLTFLVLAVKIDPRMRIDDFLQHLTIDSLVSDQCFNNHPDVTVRKTRLA